MREDDFSTGPLDIPTLRILGQRAQPHPLLDGWAIQPDELSPRRLELRIDSRNDPTDVERVRVDVRWYEGGDYTIHYLEDRSDGVWQCRWDRHPKPQGPTIHFHPPPDAAGPVEQSAIGQTHPLDVIFWILDWVGDRVEQLHET